MSFLTADLPGTGGRYKQQPSDFQVEEIPLYPCCGSGEHLYLWIEKEGIGTLELIAQLKRGLRIHEREIGHAGLKDARARTRQMISIPAACEPRLGQLQLHNARILQTDRHSNKLRLGHLAGNRFQIRLRDCQPQAGQRAEAILQRLASCGVPNRFGEQRYGSLGNSARLGLLFLQKNHAAFCRELIGNPAEIRDPDWQQAAAAFQRGDLVIALQKLPRRMQEERRLLQALQAGESPDKAIARLSRKLLRLYLSALQSQLFDRLLEQRLPQLDRLLDGDIAYKHANGACFRVVQAELEQPRADRFEISPTAPLFGHKVLRAEGQPGSAELDALRKAELTDQTWKPGPGLAMPGERRPLRVPLHQPQVSSATDSSLEIAFCLPKGSYATSVLLEIIK